MGTTAKPLYSRFRLSSPICTLHSRTGTAEPHMNSHKLHGSNTLITCVTAVCNGQTRLETLKRLYLGHCTLQTKHTFLDLWTWWCNTENSQLDGLGQSAPIHLHLSYLSVCLYISSCMLSHIHYKASSQVSCLHAHCYHPTQSTILFKYNNDTVTLKDPQLHEFA